MALRSLRFGLPNVNVTAARVVPHKSTRVSHPHSAAASSSSLFLQPPKRRASILHLSSSSPSPNNDTETTPTDTTPPPDTTPLQVEVEKVKKKEEDLWSGVSEEIREIEWPAFNRVLGTTGVVLAVIAGSSVVLLTVNAVLSELSDRVFAGKGLQDFFS
eukprot:TRINITY_DN2672_c0_g2_i2.p1 TRINITY_DN2672_c0_g2~~TRINITY_DN2672_c0_g2_i2.p1  ORF type:complete len:174 (-),score=32.33 TRINITY_DN2672_c0_g2_i2:95-571(-)